MSKVGNYEINKQTVRDIGDPNQLHDLMPLIEDLPDIPNLLSEIVPTRDEFLNTDTFEHDLRSTDVYDMGDSPYHDRGEYVGKETVNTHLFKVPHFAIQGKVRPRDVRAVRRPGSDQILDTLDRQINTELGNMRNAFSAFEERSIASTITTGQLYVPNTTVPSYDFYAEYTNLTAGTRPTVDFELDDNATRPGEKGEMVRKMIRNGLREGDTLTGIVCICGNTFFEDLIYHPRIITPRENYAVGNAAQNPLITRLRDQGMDYRMFVGPDNITYINYDGQIDAGTDPLIAPTDAYFMPQGNVDMFRRVYAPAETRQYVNTVANNEYAWRFDDEFQGTKLYMERNVGNYLINPSVLIKGIRA